MPITLSPELEAAIAVEVAAGRAKDAASLVETAVRARLQQMQALRESLDTAEADYRARGGHDHESLWSGLLADLEERV